jgi:mannose-1-phosphate guanylyltransferase
VKAILLAAGLGSRLRPITNNTPKCLVEVKGTPLIDIWISKLKCIGVDSILINTHYLASQVKNHIYNSDYKNNVQIIEEKMLEGTAGTLIKNLDFFDGNDGFLIHADNYCLDDLSNLVSTHKNRSKSCLMTMMTFSTDTPETCGIAEIDHNGILINFHEKKLNSRGNIANGAIYILSSEMLEILHDKHRDSKDFSTDIIINFCGLIQTYHTDKFFIDIGTPENLIKANSFLEY